MTVMSGDLPSARKQRYLLRRLGELIRAQGYQPFLEAPLREPSPEHFPDPWSPDAKGVRAMLQRLLRYAGLGEYQIALEMAGIPNPVYLIQESGAYALHAAAWFEGIDDGTIRFGCDKATLHDPVNLAGVLAHETAHAYRHHCELEVESEPEEEGLTDLTTVFLGFGILTVNRAPMAQGTLSEKRTVQVTGEGYLSMLDMAYLLAAQAVARGLDRRSIAEKLHHRPRRYFLAACEHLAPRRSLLLEKLHIPPEAAKPARLFNAGKTVSPVRSRRPARVLLIGAAALAAAGFAGSRVLPLPAVLAATLGALVALALAWWFLPRSRCSHPDCRAPLRQTDLVCGHCGGKVSGGLDRLLGIGNRPG